MVDFPVMIHKIHMGADLPSVAGDPDASPPVAGVPYVIYGFRDSKHDWGEVELNDPDIQPVRSACTACHEEFLVDFHALASTVTDERTGAIVETCEVCHGPGADVDAVHDIGP